MIMYTCGEEYTDSGIEIEIDNQDGLKRVTSLIVDFPLTQEGSGDPSPSNIRPFVRWNHINVNPDMYEADVDLVGGSLDVYENTLTSNYVYINSYSGEEIEEPWMSDRDVYVAGTTPSLGAQVVYESPVTSIITPTLINRDLPDEVVTVTTDITGTYINEENYSGELVTFTANAEVPLYIKVPLEPVQECTPWMSGIEKVPYTFRASPQFGNDYNREYDKLVGGTVAWNQVFDKSKNVIKSSASSGSVSIDSSTGVVAITADGSSTTFAWYESSPAPLQQHKVLVSQTVLSNKNINYATRAEASSAYTVITANTPTRLQRVIAVGNYTGTAALGGTVAGITEATDITISDIMFTDLTLALGTAIADYVYTLETNTAGTGMAWLKSHFPRMFDQYNAYEPGALESVSGVSAHEMTGFNQWDEVLETGGIDDSTGQNTTVSTQRRSENYIPALPNTAYYFSFPRVGSGGGYIYYYDADKGFIGRATYNSAYNVANKAITTPDNCHYMRFKAQSTTDNYENICINISDPALNGTYQPYTVHSYALDSSLTLRGILKLLNGELYYDGDRYGADGVVQRRYGVVDLGTLEWNPYNDQFYANIVGAKIPAYSVVANAICSKYPVIIQANLQYEDKVIAINTGQSRVNARDTSYTTVQDFKAAMSGVYLVYELATATTESATPFTTPQEVDPHGTEEYVTTSIVPVGHETTYDLVCPIEGWDEVTVNRFGKNLLDFSEFSPYANWSSSLVTYGNFPSNTYNRAWLIDGIRSGSTYSISFGISADSYPTYFYFCRANGIVSERLISFTTASYGTNSISFTVEDGWIYYLRMGSTGSESFFNDQMSKVSYAQLELGSSATPYEPYQGTSETISLPSAVYGGTLDVLSGVLTVTWAEVDLGTLTWGMNSQSYMYTNSIATLINPPSTGTAIPNIKCPMYTPRAWNTSSDNGIWCVPSTLGTRGQIWIKDPMYMDAVSFTAAMSGVPLVYELATPQEIQLTPAQINALIGTNNVWVDTGDVYVKLYNPYDVDDQAFMNMEYYDMIAHEGKMCGKYIVPIIGAKCPSNVEPYVKGKPKLPRCN